MNPDEALEFIRYLLKVGKLEVEPERVRGVVYIKGPEPHPTHRIKKALKELFAEEAEEIYRIATTVPLEPGWSRWVLSIEGERDAVVVDEPPQGMQA